MAGMTITRNRKRTESNLRVQRRTCETRAAVLARKKPLNHRWWRWYNEESRCLIIRNSAIRYTLSMMIRAKVLMLQQIKVGHPQLLDQFCVGCPQFQQNCRTGFFYFSQRLWGRYIWLLWLNETHSQALVICLFFKTIITERVATNPLLLEVKSRAISVISCNYSGWNILFGVFGTNFLVYTNWMI